MADRPSDRVEQQLRDVGGATAPRLRPDEVRRRGDRRRRRRDAALVGAAALLVAALAVSLPRLEIAGVAPPATTPGEVTPRPGAALDDVDLVAGMAAGDEGPAREDDGAGVGAMAFCNTLALPASPTPSDRIAAVGVSSQRSEAREVRLYDDESTARDVLERVTDTVAGCPEETGSAAVSRYRLERGGLPGESYVVVRTEEREDGEVSAATTWWQVTRIGPALIVGSVSADVVADEVRAAVAADTAAWGPAVADVCEVVGTRCELPPDPSPSPTAAPETPDPVREIPDDFPLASGFPGAEQTEPGADLGVAGPSRELAPVTFEGCGTRVTSTRAQDRVVATWSNPEDRRARQLLTFPDASTASDYVDRVADFVERCPQDGAQDVVSRNTELRTPPDLGEQSLALTDIYAVDGGGLAPGLGTSLVVREGRAVVIDVRSDEATYAEELVQQRLAEQVATLGPVVDAACLFTESGC